MAVPRCSSLQFPLCGIDPYPTQFLYIVRRLIAITVVNRLHALAGPVSLVQEARLLLVRPQLRLVGRSGDLVLLTFSLALSCRDSCLSVARIVDFINLIQGPRKIGELASVDERRSIEIVL